MSLWAALFMINSATGQIADGVYFIQLSTNNNLMEAEKTTYKNNGCKIQIWENKNGANQMWQVTKTNRNTYKLKNVGSNKVLDAYNKDVNVNGCKVQLWNDIPNSLNQEWTLTTLSGGGKYAIRNAASTSNKVLDVTNSKVTSFGTAIQLWDLSSTSGAGNQSWTFVPVSSFDVIAVFPEAMDNQLQNIFKSFGGRIIDISPYSKTRLWRFPEVYNVPNDISHSYSNRTDGVEKVRGETAGVGMPTTIMYNIAIVAPEGNGTPNYNSLQQPLPPPIPILPVSCEKVAIQINAGQKRGVTVAFIDSGVPCDKGGQTHPYLKTTAWYNTVQFADRTRDSDVNGYSNDIMGWDFVSNSFIPNDELGHGTATASIVWSQFHNAGKLNMLKIMPLKVLNKTGTGTLYNLIKAIDYATEKNVDMINISIISPDPTVYKLPTPVEHVIALAEKKNILVVAAAGNGGADIRSDNIDLRANYLYPASAPNPNMLVVGASDCTNGITSFSNYGIQNVDIFAPGKNIGSFWLPLSSGNSTIVTFSPYLEGTSYATPIVTGVAALLGTYQVSKNSEALKKAIIEGGNRYDNLGDKCVSKALINAPNALAKLPR